MRVYIEFFEVAEDVEADFMRIDVTDFTQEDISLLVEELKAWLQTNYTNYVLQMHYCRHDQNDSCAIEILERRQ